MCPETAIGIERKTQFIPVTQRPDLGRNAALVRERIIRRDRAVRAQTNDLPQIDRHVLRRIKFLPFARGNEQILPIWREGEAMGEMTVARNLRNLPTNDFQVPDLCGLDRKSVVTGKSV